MSNKPFTTYQQQIEYLQNIKKLKIADQSHAIAILKRTSYFSLINGYKDLFKVNISGEYKAGICFNDIYCLYHLDEQLRTLLIKNILIIERQLKSLISYYFSEKFGNEQTEYLNTSHYQYSTSKPKVSSDVAELISILNKTLNSNDYRYINHNRTVHGNVPLWVLINALSFGKISKMFALSLPSIQQKVCNEYQCITISEMTNMLSVLTKFRNVCAHNERLYNYKTKDTLPMMNIHNALNLPRNKAKSSYRCGVNDFFAVVIIFKCLLSDNDFLLFFDELNELILNFKFETNIVNKISVLSAMGLPSNWKDIAKVTNQKL